MVPWDSPLTGVRGHSPLHTTPHPQLSQACHLRRPLPEQRPSYRAPPPPPAPTAPPSALPLRPAPRRRGRRSCCPEMLPASPATEQQRSRHRQTQLAGSATRALGTEVAPKRRVRGEGCLIQQPHLVCQALLPSPVGTWQLSPRQTVRRAALATCAESRQQGPSPTPAPPSPLLLLRGPCWRPGAKGAPLPLLRCRGRCKSRTWRRPCRC